MVEMLLVRVLDQDLMVVTDNVLYILGSLLLWTMVASSQEAVVEVEEEKTPITNTQCNRGILVKKDILVIETKLYKTSSMEVEVAVEQDILTPMVVAVEQVVVMVVQELTTLEVVKALLLIIHNQASLHTKVEMVEILVKMVKMVLVVVAMQEVRALQSMVGVTEQGNLATDTIKPT
jgi:hypothetical protein